MTGTDTSITVRLLGGGEAAVLDDVAADVFDNPVHPRWRAEFFADPRHHIVVAMDGRTVVGMTTAVHYVHPDKPPELWINEVGVAPSHQGRGLGRSLLGALLDHGAGLGCAQAWVLTEPSNTAARRLYAAAGGQPAPEPAVLFEFPIAASPSST